MQPPGAGCTSKPSIPLAISVYLILLTRTPLSLTFILSNEKILVEHEELAPARRQRRGAPHLQAPMLTQQQYTAVHDLASAPILETDGRERFESATPEDLLLAAETFARYRPTTLPIIRQTDALSRRMFLQDLRDLDSRYFPELQLVMQLLSHFTPWPSGIALTRRVLLAKKLFPQRNFVVIPLTSALRVLSSNPTS